MESQPSSSSSSATSSATAASSVLGSGSSPSDAKLELAEDMGATIQKVLRRVERSKIRRTLEQRLGYASYKVSRGWTQYPLDAIEPQVEREVEERKRQAAAQENDKRRAGLSGQSAAHLRSESYQQPYPPGQSLFDAMLTPAMGGGLGGAFSPNPDASTSTFPSQPSSSNKRARLDSGRVSRAAEMPANALKHKSAGRVSFESGAGRSNGTQQSAPVQYRPISSSDPHFATSATEYVAAANALTSFTRGQSAGPVDAQAPIVESSGKRSGAPESGKNRESEAELMLFLAHSPSPQRKKAPTAPPAEYAGEALQPRRLFTEETNAAAPTPKSPVTSRTVSTLAPTTGVQENAAVTPPVAARTPTGLSSGPVPTPQPLGAATSRAWYPAPATTTLAGAFEGFPGSSAAASAATTSSAW